VAKSEGVHLYAKFEGRRMNSLECVKKRRPDWAVCGDASVDT